MTENKIQIKQKELSAMQQTLINFPHHIFFTLMFIFNGYFITKSITKNEWSAVSLVFMIIELSGMFVSLGTFNMYGLYLLDNKDDKEKRQEIIGFGIIIFFIVSLLFIIFNLLVLLPLSYFIFDKTIFHLILIGLPITFLINSISFIDTTNKYIGKIHYNTIFKWGHLIFMMIFTVLLYYLGFLNINTIMYMNYVIVGIFFLPYFFVWKPKFNNIKKYFNNFKGYIKHGFNVYIMGIFMKTSELIDKIILGIFALSQIIIVKIGNIFFVPLNKFWEDYSKAKIKDFKKGKDINKKDFFYMGITYLIYGIIFYFGAVYLIKYMYGQEYIYVVDYTVFFAINGIILSYTNLFYNYLHIHNKIVKTMRNKVIYRFIINFILSLLLIPFFGIVGAFISVIFSHLFILIEYYLIYRKKL